MSALDTIRTALEILMVVCVYLDSGVTVFSGIQIIGLLESFLYIAHPEWRFWDRSFYMVNLPLELVCIACTKRYGLPRFVMGLHAFVKMMVYFHVENLAVSFHGEKYIMFKQHSMLHVTGALNQVIILTLLIVSVHSLFTTRSQNVKFPIEARGKQARRSPYSTASSAPFHQPAFVKGLY